jgi:hypothetical protein
VNLSAFTWDVVPPGVDTVMWTVAPVVPAGAVAVIVVSLVTLKEVAAVPPNLTEVAPVKNDPVIVTLVPPRCVPVVGATAVTTGTG